MKTNFNLASRMLAAIGGLAAMVAGVGGSYYPDRATEPRRRKGKSAGQYGRNLRAHFARERMKMPGHLRGKSLT
jgi:hypothetical protein